ncbi:hypothetical protein EES44_24460 [Streptomyces sp. ADI96-15]|uniref:hypothetical protein n=1 Tax=Streptomyces sp. ADI96-15 TaxID=1522761 RepID=UPI000FBBAEDC|nr:hypothetical protein [Streptomyces sp. ADI96-15]RPK58088.1 hypothetical protein EES44_24460 [Streptomyces sp. ADI96-15]
MDDTRIAADITVSAVALTDGDLDELRVAVEEAVSAWKADVTVNSWEYPTA